MNYRIPVNIYSVFQKRFDAVHFREDYAHLRHPKFLQQALDVLNAVGNALSDKYSERIAKLHNYNLRDAIDSFTGIISNRRWMQRDREYESHFTVDEHNFALSPASVLRALGLGEGLVYPYDDTCIANILWNTREPASDMLLVYVLKYFVTKTSKQEAQDEVLASIGELLPQGFNPTLIRQMVNYAISKKLLHNELSPRGESLSLTPRAAELLRMLGESSMLLELYRDDICLLPLQDGRAARITREYPSAAEAFTAIGQLIEELWVAEERLRTSFTERGASHAGSSYFGPIFEAANMRKAFLSSMSSFYRSDDREKWPVSVQKAMHRLSALRIPEFLRSQ